jgi:predicted nucleic acid-binding protein
MSTLAGITLDTGALIALERGRGQMSRRMKRVHEIGVRVTVPAVVLIEWWRAGFGRRHSDILAPMHVEPTTQRIARAAGEALTTTRASAVDAAVMASAALRGDVVFTSDLDDLGRLQAHFPTVRLFGV